MKKAAMSIADETVTADRLGEYDRGDTGRGLDLPLLGWVIGSSVSLLLWTAFTLSAWALLMR